MTKHLLVLLVFFPLCSFSQLWQNDFSNATEWISSDLNSGTDAWIIGSTGIGGDVDSINSASAGNGFAQFNSEDQCNAAHQDVVLMYYQPIDISANQLSYFEFVQHYKRKSDSVFVEFSNDGLTWESVRINQEYWYYQQTVNPDTVKVSIPASVQSQPFYLRFKYTGECGYAWLLDDLKIFEKEQYAGIAETTILINGRTYKQANHCVMDTLDYGVILKNFGYDTLYNLIVDYTIYKDGVLQSNQKDTVVNLLPMQEIDTVFYAVQNTNGGSQFDYQIDAAIYSDELDTILQSNFLDVTDDELRKDQDSIQGFFQTSTTTWGIGQTFIATEEYCSKITRVFIPETMPDGHLAYLIWFKLVNGQWVYHGLSGDEVLNATTSGYWAYFDSGFNDVYFENDTGLVVFSSYGEELPVAYAQKSREDDLYLLDENFALTHVPDGHSLLIELQTNYLQRCNCFLSITEENAENHMILAPNPAITEIRIQNVTEPFLSVKIFSLDGREVYSDFEITSETISVSFLETGTYFIVVGTIEGNFYSERFIKL